MVGDLKNLSERDENTLNYILTHFKFTVAAEIYMKTKMGGGAVSPFMTVKGVRYGRDVLEHAKACAAKDGGITVLDAEKLYNIAMDDNVITAIERKTLEYVMSNLRILPEAKSLLQTKLESKKIEQPGPNNPEDQKKVQAEKKEDLEAMDKYTSELKDEATKIFKDMDTDGDGCVSPDELKAFVVTKDALLEIKLGIGKWEDFIAKADADGDGNISQDEFVSYIVNLKVDVGTVAGILFDAMDADGDKVVSFDEAKNYEWEKNPNIFKALNFQGSDDMFACIGFQDGKMRREDFIAFFTKEEHQGTFLFKNKRQRVN